MKNKKSLDKISKLLCLILRHKPEIIDAIVDNEGWSSISHILNKLNLNEKTSLTVDELNKIITDDNKGRYSVKDSFEFIRCNQGHSLEYVDIKFEEYFPDDVLYHGTSPDFVDSILKNGIRSQRRNYVHLSKDLSTAIQVGKRHSKEKEPVVFCIQKNAPIKFWITENNVVQSKYIDPKYITIV